MANLDSALPALNDSTQAIGEMRARIDQRLREILPKETMPPAQLHQAMAHTVLSPGKRYRPLLTLLIAEASGADNPGLYDIACTSELVHAASLIFDDLPCMDDAQIRRNAPCAHLEFDESTAILAATALLNLAYGVIANAEGLTVEQQMRLTKRLSHHVGSDGLIAGQMMDLLNNDTDADVKEVERLNQLKTGSMISYPVEAAVITANLSDGTQKPLNDFAYELGLAYQLMDDIKDQLLSSDDAQKDTDQDEGKNTIVALKGLGFARQKVTSHVTRAKAHLVEAGLGDHHRLLTLVDQQFSILLDSPRTD